MASAMWMCGGKAVVNGPIRDRKENEPEGLLAAMLHFGMSGSGGGRLDTSFFKKMILENVCGAAGDEHGRFISNEF
jgi:hypothetical protein